MAGLAESSIPAIFSLLERIKIHAMLAKEVRGFIKPESFRHVTTLAVEVGVSYKRIEAIDYGNNTERN